ncbi:hypothetical protein [Candidatus Oleimmundimicrobium sp.]|uniref:hypothetical protein n=1 Tax=Candidatus Oleimmundimicrobium sp. TaxID=3060597 RepID=UPI00271D6523|nr:hypothetical protein [Candidatus Oleimmundimicrobium sp.]MDO8886930.1 hypothetical protein [Candidatus Oleimmundimicrobium sp.]
MTKLRQNKIGKRAGANYLSSLSLKQLILNINPMMAEGVKKIVSSRIKLKKIWSIVFLLFLISSFCFPLFPNGALAQGNKKVVLVVINNLSADELVEANPLFFKKLADEGAVGLMNCRTASTFNPYDTYLSIGSGSKAKAGASGGQAFNASEIYIDSLTAADVFFQRTGELAPRDGVVNLAIANIISNSESIPRDSVPGALGQALKKAGFKVAVLGNADSAKEYHREISLIAMDEKGVVQQGDVDRSLVKTDSNMGIMTNYDELFSKATELLQTADFLAIELGDTFRLEKEKRFFTEEAITKHKLSAITFADKYVERLFTSLSAENGEILLIVLAPATSEEARKNNNFLAPIIISGSATTEGLLISETTRWPGIIDNTDIVPTVLDFLGANSPQFLLGRPATILNQEAGLEYINNLSKRFETKSQARVPLLTAYVTFVAIMVLLTALFSVIKVIPKKILQSAQLILLWLISIPVAFEFFAPIKYNVLLVPIICVSAIAAFILLGARLLKGGPLTPIIMISFLTVSVLVIDIFTGWNLVRGSILGYCPNIGARFYGIGNEYMGILLGSGIIGITSFLDERNLNSKFWHLVVGLIFLFLIVIIGHPALGANVGGTIAAIVGFGATFLILKEGSLKKKHFGYILISILLGISLFVGIDLLRGEFGSHIGRSIALIRQGGITEVIKIIQRKIAMNYEGMRYTVWTRVLLATIVAFPILFLRPTGLLKDLREKYPNLIGGISGTALGALAALIFNDTGAAAAAAIIMFAIVALLYIIVDERVKET